MATTTYRAVRVPHDARSWATLDARWREGFVAGVRAASGGEPWRVLGHGGAVLEEGT
jgi:hypothetical protein